MSFRGSTNSRGEIGTTHCLNIRVCDEQRDLENVLHLRKPMGTSIPGQGSLQTGSFAQKLGKKEQN